MAARPKQEVEPLEPLGMLGTTCTTSGCNWEIGPTSSER